MCEIEPRCEVVPFYGLSRRDFSVSLRQFCNTNQALQHVDYMGISPCCNHSHHLLGSTEDTELFLFD